ncbi:hypothetical protein F1721_02080 [Saccharopolyspora hirsuta]|uniref:DUF6923 domain-containing protein n=1 Tax=Saccharopolyspora hirsuta TaxID=1837 RepID=A0A5M7C7F9_SACHI|nr:hypothetical protein [Saccharopolyspora hirsuta]KAA5838256.1 hypothetical protein F1721_02080 [Saccharopolyspora hirsuta]
MRWAAAAAAALVLLASVAWVAGAAAVPGCSVLQIRNRGGLSTLHRVDFPAADSTRLDAPGYRLNALGYSAPQRVVYGMASRGASGPFPDGGHAVAVTPDGRTRDLGPVRAGREGSWWHPLRAPSAGAVSGNRWYLVEDGYLHVVDVDPGSRTYLEVLSTVGVEGLGWPMSLDDFDVDPVDGQLYGISATSTGVAAVVRLDRGGRVVAVTEVPELPPLSYGSVVIGPDRALYATADESGAVYRVERDGSATWLATVLPMASSDAAGCLTGDPPDPPPTTAPPPPTTTAPPTTSPASEPPVPPSAEPPSSSSVPEPGLPPGPSPTPEPPPPSPPPAPPTPGNYAVPTEEPEVETSGHTTEEKRRWALAALVLLIGGSAAVRRLAR